MGIRSIQQIVQIVLDDRLGFPQKTTAAAALHRLRALTRF
jgi:hypothetical protein